MSGPLPKHPSARARRNIPSTAATLEKLEPADRRRLPVPEMPADREWDPKTSDWWTDVHQSPMRLEWDPADMHAITQIAYLLDMFYIVVGVGPVFDDRAAVRLSNQIRQRSTRLGIDPFARRSMQWMLVETERSEAERDLAKTKLVEKRGKTGKKRGGGFGTMK